MAYSLTDREINEYEFECQYCGVREDLEVEDSIVRCKNMMECNDREISNLDMDE